MTQKQDELDSLAATFTTPPSVILEIGVDQGRSFHHWETCWPTATLIGIDLDGATWSSGPVINDTRIIHGDSHDPATLQAVKDRLAGAHVDFLFIDGDHSFDGVAQDYWNYRRLVRQGGTIALHDICPHPAATGVHVHDFWTRIRHRGPTSEIIHPPKDWGGIGVIHKNGRIYRRQLRHERPHRVAGKRPPYTDSHAPTCACTRCQEMDEAMSDVAGAAPHMSMSLAGQTVDATRPPNIIPLAATTTTCRCGQPVHTLTTGRTTHTLDAPIHGLTERFDTTGQVVAYDHLPVWPAHTCTTAE